MAQKNNLTNESANASALNELLLKIDGEMRARNKQGWGTLNAKDSPAYAALKTGPVQDQASVVHFVFTNRKARDHIKRQDLFYNYAGALGFEVFVSLMRGALPLKVSEMQSWLDQLRQDSIASRGLSMDPLDIWPIGLIVQQIERAASKAPLSGDEKGDLENMLFWDQLSEHNYYGSDFKRVRARIEKILGASAGCDPEIQPYRRLSGDKFGEGLLATRDGLDLKTAELWNKTFHLAASANGGKPTQKFLTQSGNLRDAHGKDKMRGVMQGFLDATVKAPVTTVNRWPPNIFFTKSNALLVKGLVWMCLGYQDKRTIHLIADICEKSMKKLPESGIAAQSVANACLYYLEQTPGQDVAARLSRLVTMLRQKTVKARVQAAIEEKAAKAGLTAAQLEERVVPDFGLMAGAKSSKTSSLISRLRGLERCAKPG